MAVFSCAGAWRVTQSFLLHLCGFVLLILAQQGLPEQRDRSGPRSWVQPVSLGAVIKCFVNIQGWTFQQRHPRALVLLQKSLRDQTARPLLAFTFFLDCLIGAGYKGLFFCTVQGAPLEEKTLFELLLKLP